MYVQQSFLKRIMKQTILTSFLFLSFFISPPVNSSFFRDFDAEQFQAHIYWGQVGSYRIKQRYYDAKSMLLYTNDKEMDGNAVHYLIGWEFMKELDWANLKDQHKEDDLGKLLIEEVEYMYRILGLNHFLRLLTRKRNYSRYSAIELALVSKHFSESDDNWRDKVRPYLSEETIDTILVRHQHQFRAENRGLAYDALRTVVASHIIEAKDSAPGGSGGCLPAFKKFFNKNQLQTVKTMLDL